MLTPADSVTQIRSFAKNQALEPLLSLHCVTELGPIFLASFTHATAIFLHYVGGRVPVDLHLGSQPWRLDGLDGTLRSPVPLPRYG